MSAASEPPVVQVGTVPWLPWPLSGMHAWTAPVAAKRLAALRIGLSLVLLLDVFTSYWPNRQLFFGPESLATLENYNWYAQDGKRNWSILRGPGDDLNFTLILFAAMGLTVYLMTDLRARWSNPEQRASMGSLVAGWCVVCGLALWGYWIRLLNDGSLDGDSPRRVWMWLVPLLLCVLSALFLTMEAWIGARAGVQAWSIAACLYFPLLTVTGFLLHLHYPWKEGVTPAWLYHFLEPWMRSHAMIAVCLAAWILAIVLLLVGWHSRFAAVTCWVLSMSFGNVNPHIDNAGDTIRNILLFYLMLCPCGAVWSLDCWRNRRDLPAGTRLVVSPWPIGLIFTQMILVYFLNGAYKVLSADWVEGATLYYVLHDTTLTRFSFLQLPLDYPMTRMMTWTVLAWELSFPLLVLYRPTRILALCVGVLFHLGIAFTMDLGFFAAYALCMYLPLIPWGTFPNAPEAT